MLSETTQTTQLVYDGRNNPNVLNYYVEGLETGAAYTFNLEAYNFNGAGPSRSNDATFTACTAPSDLSPLSIITSTETAFTFSWEAPADNGGC